ncbi:hypothetical protein [Marinicella marina]|uniref:hypothetical protein n=1 Tax=Marinicella marina TaxID=2996016 RepID=UPI0024BC8F8F|nr:hypothetical protein [Marinicella marina]MDJ1138970.1 hypothetical protein [Marinicella marina]
MQTLPFYIIITPRSLKYLKFAVWSLQVRKDMTVILVANGLDQTESTDLTLFAEQIGCDLINLPTKKVMSHGASLDYLLAQHSAPWFCFCDSDIISHDDDACDIYPASELKAISSCDAMFWDDSEVKGVLGRCNKWPDGSPNMASFFCVYETSTLKRVRAKYDIGFDNITYNQIHSTDLRQLLLGKGINEQSRKLDTGKALTAAMELEQVPFEHKNIASLLHVGGLSSWMLNGDRKLVHSAYHLTDEDLYQIAGADSWLFNLNSQREPEHAIFYLRRQQRLAAARYCFQLISHHVDHTPMPTHDLSDQDFIAKIGLISDAIGRYYQEFP